MNIVPPQKKEIKFRPLKMEHVAPVRARFAFGELICERERVGTAVCWAPRERSQTTLTIELPALLLIAPDIHPQMR